MHVVISEIITFCVITLCVRKVISICVKRLLHFALKILFHFASMLLHFAGIITFCGVTGSLKNDDGNGDENGQKSNTFRLAEQQPCTCITSFCTFLCRRCAITRWKCLIRFVEEGNTRHQRSLYLYTHVVLFLFLFFWKASASARVRQTRERSERAGSATKISFPHPYPFALGEINLPRFKFYHARPTDFEQKIECLWTGY